MLGLCALSAFALGSQGAQAGSRFETRSHERAEVVAHLDFTIVIPELVYLGPERGTQSHDQFVLLAQAKPSRAAPGGPYAVLTNAGTPAFMLVGAPQPQSMPPAGQDQLARPQASRAYVVAIP